MNLKNRLLLSLTKGMLKKNKRFENIHKGESCYIFGNGISLKYFDLNNFSDRPSIACGLMFLHKDFRKLDIRYFYEGHPFYFYRYWLYPYGNKLEKNRLGIFSKKNILMNDDIDFFCSISNCFGIFGKNIHYIHHYGQEFDSFSQCRPDGVFSSMNSGLGGMLGLAMFMGFSDITLVGCDYAFFPQAQGHFYEYGLYSDTFYDTPFNKAFFLDSMRHAKVRVVTPSDDYKGHMLPHVSYEELTGHAPQYRENSEILSDADLMELDRGTMPYKIFP